MEFFKKLFEPKVQPEELYKVTTNEEGVKVEHPKIEPSQIRWDKLHTIILVNTDEGPALSDVWLKLIDDNGSCSIPQGNIGFEQVYDIVSKYDGFDFDNFVKSMATASNAQFLLWAKKTGNALS